MPSLLGLVPLAAGYFLSYLFRNVNGVIAGDIMRDLGIGADALGLLTSIYFLTFAAAQLPVGVWLDRFGPRRVQSALLCCAAAGSALCALHLGFAVLLLGRALIGLGTAGGLVAGLKASAEWFPRERLPLVNSGLIMCGGLGAFAATWPVEFTLRQTDWRGLLLVLALSAAAVGLAVLVLVPGREVRETVHTQSVRLSDVLRDRQFQRFAPVSATCFGSVLAVQGLWAGPWLAEVDGLTRPEVANDLALMALVLILAAPLWGVLTKKLRPLMPLTHVAAGACALIMVTEVVIMGTTGVASVLAWGVFAVFGGITVLSYSAVAELFPPATIGRANGALNVLHIACSFALQLGIGQIVSLWRPVAGHYPVLAYQAGLALPLTLQGLALVWFAWPRAAGQQARPVPAECRTCFGDPSRVEPESSALAHTAQTKEARS